MDQDPAIFVIKLEYADKKIIFVKRVFEGTFTSFFKDKKSKNNGNQGFSHYFCLMVEGPGSGPLTSGSVSRRPKNIRIRRIRIRNSGRVWGT
jgi:hypothetical protein